VAEPEQILVALAAVFVLGVGGQWLAWRIRLPSILVLMTLGVLVGPVTGWIQPDALFPKVLLPCVSLAVAVILFEGSMNLRLADLREIGWPLGSLLTLGVVIAWALIAASARYVLDFDWKMSLLLGALLTVTGPTVIGPLLRHIRPLGRVGPIARWEGVVIDPIGAVLAVLVYEALLASHATDMGSAWQIGAKGLFVTLLIGLGIGAGVAYSLLFVLRRHAVPDHLQSPMALMAVLGSFAASNVLHHESGLVTVTVMGLILANQKRVTVKHILRFKENLTVLLISTLFIVLTARLEFEHITTLSWRGPLFVVVLIVLVRPVSVFLGTMGTGLTNPERAFLAWLAPRGIVAAAVASVFALHLAGGDHGAGGEHGSDALGQQFVAATFLVIAGTVIVYGLTSGIVARKLGLSVPNPQGVLMAGAHPAARAIAHALVGQDIAVQLVDTNPDNIRTARMEGLTTMYANVLSETTTEELDLGGIGRFMALTSNDEINSLAAEHFHELFGRAETYRLAKHQAKSDRKEVAEELMFGRTLFNEELTHEVLDKRFEEGAVMKATRLSEEFAWPKFREQYGDEAILMFAIDGAGQLSISTADAPLKPGPGDTVMALVDPPEENASSTGAEASESS